MDDFPENCPQNAHPCPPNTQGGRGAVARFFMASSVGHIPTYGRDAVVGQWYHNGFKVGPNYCAPTANVADSWLEANDPRLA